MANLEQFLKQTYHFSSFRPGQKEVISALLAKQSMLAILPTGNGKSLCYQFYGRYTNKRVLIVSPLLSLMQDQVSQMKYQGYQQVIALTSEQDYLTRQKVLANLGAYQYIFLAPEILQNQLVKQALQTHKIGLLVVDEAHCISTWGPDFRPDYLQLGKLQRLLGQPLTLALTATATPKVKEDICQQLGLSKVYQRSVNRENIYLEVLKVASQSQKNQKLLELVNYLQGPGLIYFSSKKLADRLAKWLGQRSQLRVAAYHAGLSHLDRYSIQQQFLQGQLDLVCATSAFGMGVNKEDIRYVIHYHLPSDLNSYVQEIGRAGRDGKQSCAILLYQAGDEFIQRQLLENTLPAPLEISQYFMSKAQGQSKISSEKQRLLASFNDQVAGEQRALTFFAARKKERLTALKQMATYAKTSGCLRQYILTYFAEKPGQHNDYNCCHNADYWQTLAQLGLKRKSRDERSNACAGEFEYQTILAQLFTNYNKSEE